jgi:hypothetical protein
MALALRLDKLLAAGMVKDFRTLAHLGHVSPARISQIMSLLHLAPDIQEALLFRTRPERGRDSLGLRQVLPLTKVWDWHKQRPLWRRLSGQRLDLAATGRKRLRKIRLLASHYSSPAGCPAQSPTFRRVEVPMVGKLTAETAS